jgi:branched-chain amino acid transport system substrate-binding protein
MEMKRMNIFAGIILVSLCLVFLLAGCAQKEEKNVIRIGASRSLTGPFAPIGKLAFGPIFQMWVDEVNATGGIYIKEYDKKLPVETVIYDDESSQDIMVRNLEKLIVEDKVDFIFPPVGTHFVLVAAPIVNKYEYLFVAMEGGASQIKEIIAGMPYFFSALSFSTHNQIPALADLMESEGVKTAAIVFLADDHGVEYSSAAVPQLALKGIDVSMIKSISMDVKDLSDVINEAKATSVDAFCIFAYPDQTLLSIGQSIQLGFNPKLFITSVGANFEFFQQSFGPAAEGVMGFGAWNAKVSPAHKELAEKITKQFGKETLDWWGHNLYYGALQFWQQAVEKAGTLDQSVIRDIFASEKFDTILGPTWFDENHLLATECHTGEVGQWQNGVFEVIAPSNKATAKPIYPKPAWPSQ